MEASEYICYEFFAKHVHVELLVRVGLCQLNKVETLIACNGFTKWIDNTHRKNSKQ